MSLKDKQINVQGNLYKVDDQFTSTSNNEEILILKRTLPTVADNAPTTIFDLGYEKADDIDYSVGKIDKAIELIEASSGHDIEIAAIDPSGLIEIQVVTLRGVSIMDPDVYKVDIQESGKAQNIKLKIEFLVSAFLLAEEFTAAKKDYYSSNNTGYDEALRGAEQNSNQDAPDLEEMFGPDIKKVFTQMGFDPEKHEVNVADLKDIPGVGNVMDMLGEVLKNQNPGGFSGR